MIFFNESKVCDLILEIILKQTKKSITWCQHSQNQMALLYKHWWSSGSIQVGAQAQF